MQNVPSYPEFPCVCWFRRLPCWLRWLLWSICSASLLLESGLAVVLPPQPPLARTPKTSANRRTICSSFMVIKWFVNGAWNSGQFILFKVTSYFWSLFFAATTHPEQVLVPAKINYFHTAVDYWLINRLILISVIIHHRVASRVVNARRHSRWFTSRVGVFPAASPVAIAMGRYSDYHDQKQNHLHLQQTQTQWSRIFCRFWVI